ncbi:MAG: hypothetical protein HYY52_00030 [Candidatus Melainabacteria bacterium]|nr:hypothetical protein [Candidatus Melainabacteria bacterium]
MDKLIPEPNSRNDLKTLSIASVWNELKYLADKESSSISSYIRRLVKKEYAKERKKELAPVG